MASHLWLLLMDCIRNMNLVRLRVFPRIAAVAQIFITGETMTELTLRHEAPTGSGLFSLGHLLKEMFSATPLGLVLAAFGNKR
jgi:hypothetical protein